MRPGRRAADGGEQLMKTYLWSDGAEKNATGTCRIWAICCNRPAPMRLVPFSYFCTCWKVRPSLSASFCWGVRQVPGRQVSTRPGRGGSLVFLVLVLGLTLLLLLDEDKKD